MAVAFYKVAEEIEALDLEGKIYLKDILSHDLIVVAPQGIYYELKEPGMALAYA